MTRGAPRSLCAALAIVALPAHAHLIETGMGPAYDGVSHFALTPEDIAPTLALALFAGLRGSAHGRRAMLALPAAWFVSGCFGLAAAGLTNDITLGALSWLPLLVLGGLVAADVRVSVRITTALAIALGLFLGFENGVTMAPPGPGLSALTGVVICAFVVVTLTSALVASRNTQLMRIAARVIGSWIAASGVLLLGWSLR
jgi:urease accessory protein